MIDTTSKWLLGISAVLALLVGVAVYVAVSQQGLGRPTAVVVARQDIPERTLFTGSNVSTLLEVRQLPADSVPRGALSRPEEAIGKTTTTPLASGEVMLDTPNRLVGTQGEAARPAASIPRDKMALAITANDSVSVAGAVRPGDHVDVIATWNGTDSRPVTQNIFHDVRVFAVGRWQNGLQQQVSANVGASDNGSTVTLLLDYQEAVVLEYLLRTGGSVSIGLRRFDQAGDIPTTPVTPDSLARRFLEAQGERASR